MAWNPNDKNNYAGHSKEVSEHGGVEQYNSDIYNEGYNDGCKDTFFKDVIIALGCVVVYKLIKCVHYRHQLKVEKKSKLERTQDDLTDDEAYAKQTSNADSSITEGVENNE